MSKLEELIQQYCPDGVEYKPLWSITNWDKKFNGIDKSKQKIVLNFFHVSAEKLKSLDSENGSIRLLSTGLYEGYANEEGNEEIINDGEVISLPSGGTANIKYCKGKFIDSGNLLCSSSNKDKYDLYYIYHYLLNVNSIIQNCYRGSGVKHPDMSRILEIEVPVPALPVQREIAHILGEFSLLSAELAAELAARKQQYEYYRDELLTFKTDVEWKTIKEIATDIYRGSGIKRDQVTEEGIPCVRYGEIYTTYNTWFDNCVSHTQLESIDNPKYFEHGDILFAITGESVEDIAKSVAYVGSDKCLAGGDIVVLKHTQNPKYLAYALETTDARNQKSKGKVKSKVVHSSVPAIEAIKVPIPSLEIQERIVHVLDNFDAICSDLKIGLPAEIEARQKQYEYYRDLLLTFNNKLATIPQTDRQTDRLK